MRDFFNYINIYNMPPRLGRIKYIVRGITNTVILLAVFLLVPMLFYYFEIKSEKIFGILTMLFVVSMFANAIILPIKRLHDINSSGWKVLLILVPIVNIIFAIYLLFCPGDKSDNRFGPPCAKPNLLEYIITFAGLPIIGVTTCSLFIFNYDLIQKLY